MTVTNINNTTTSRYDKTYTDSVRTANYHALRAKGALLPVNTYKYVHLSGSTPRANLPASQGGTIYGWQSQVPEINVDMFEILGDTAGTGFNREVTISNGMSLGSNPNAQKSMKGFPSVYGAGIRVSNKLVKKLNNRDIDLGVALGEARETAAFVQGAMLSTYRAYHSARRGDVSGMLTALGLTKTKDRKRQQLREVPDAAANVWLTYSYAVRPLLADVYGALSALEKRHARPDVVHLRASELNELSYAMATSGANPGYIDVEWSVKGSLRSSAELSFEIANPFLYTLSQVGLTNPLNVAWELVPFSFVVDWFIPVGKWFDGLVPPQGTSNLKGSQSYKGEYRGKGKLIGNFPVPPNTPDGSREWTASWFSKFKGRSPITSFPRYHLVGATFDLGVAQIASGLSLLWSVGAGRKAEQQALSGVKDSMHGSAWSRLGSSLTGRL